MDHDILPTGGSRVTLWVIGVELLKVKVLHVWPNVGKSKCNVFVMTYDYARKACRCDTRDPHTGRSQVNHMPNWWRGRGEMWVVCKQWLTRGRTFTTDDPVIAGRQSFGVKTDSGKCCTTYFLRF